MSEPPPPTPPTPSQPSNPAPIADEMLAAYALGEVDEPGRARIDSALAGSAALRDKLAKIRSTATLLAETTFFEPGQAALQRVLGLVPAKLVPAKAAAGSWLRRAADAVARVAFDSLATPALAGFRGGTTGPRHMTFDCDAGEIDLRVTRVDAKFRILGQFSPNAGEARGAVGLVPEQGDDAIESPLDDKGRFSAEVGPGGWEIKINLGERVIALPRLVLE